MTETVLTAALTGPIATKAANPALPTSPEEIAAAAAESHAAGAAIVHVHLRETAVFFQMVTGRLHLPVALGKAAQVDVTAPPPRHRRARTQSRTDR